MVIPVRDLASFDEANSQWITEAGNYIFQIGSSSRDIKATASLKLAEYTEPTTNALAPQQSLNLLKQ
jgi:beta-glucosidase